MLCASCYVCFLMLAVSGYLLRVVCVMLFVVCCLLGVAWWFDWLLSVVCCFAVC